MGTYMIILEKVVEIDAFFEKNFAACFLVLFLC